MVAATDTAALPGAGDVVVLWLVVAVLIAINGLFVAAEIALVGVRPTHLQRLAEGGSSAAAHLLSVLGTPESQRKYFATTQLGVTAASIGLGMYGEHQLAGQMEPLMLSLGLPAGAAHAVAVPISIALLTFLHVVIGEMVPKSLALRFPSKAVQRIAPIMRTAQKMVRPMVWLLSGLSGLALRALPFPASTGLERIMSAREIGRIIEDSAEVGLISQPEERILLDVIDFGDREVHQVMTARTQIVAFPVDIDEDDLARELADQRHTRFPIYEDDLDHILGVLHIKDYLRARSRSEPFDLRGLVREAQVIPEHISLAWLLESFRRSREHLAIVIDEYGGTAGIVTLEDVVEELVGEVRDEFDSEEVAPIRTVRAGVLSVRGEVQLVDLVQQVRLPDDRPDVDTVGGLMVNLLGRPAEEDDQVWLGDMRLTAQRVSGYRVELVRIELEPENTPPEADAQTG